VMIWRRKRWAQYVLRVREKGNVQRVVVRKQEGIRTTGRSSVRWQDTVVIDLRKKMQRRELD